MALDVTGLESVASVYSTELATKAITSAATAKLLIANHSVQTGVKGTAALSTMDSDIILQDSSTCSARTPLGSTSLANKRITVTSLKDLQNFCFKAFYDTYFAELIGRGQQPENEDLDATVVKAIIDYRVAKLAGINEKLIWIGDTAGAAGNYDKIDGILKQLQGTYGFTAITPVGATLIAKLQSVYNQSNIDVRHSDDFRIFMGQDTYDAYIASLTAMNLFNPAGTDVTIIGTSSKVFVAPGLNGTNKVVAGRISNFRLGMDSTDDSEKVSFKYSMETNQFYMDIYYSIGVAVVFPSETGVATVA